MSFNPAEIVASPEFSKFLIDAKQHGYGSPDAQVVTTRGGAKELWYEEPPFIYVDHFVGGNAYGGHEFVAYELNGFVKHKPLWNMSYYETFFEGITGTNIGRVLGLVLSQPDADLPLRGPRNWEEQVEGLGDVRYSLRPVDRTSSLARFDVEERVVVDGKKVYVARFMGGLVNNHD